MITAVINGEQSDLPDGTSLQSFLETQSISLSTVVIELNGKIKSRDEWSKSAINNDDNIEILNFLGGG